MTNTLPLRWISYLFFTLVFGSFCYVIFDILAVGARNFQFDFLTLSPRSAGRLGGIYPIIISTLLVLVTSVVIALPLSLMASIFLNEWLPKNGFIHRSTLGCIDILASMPSIVFGLFGNAFFCVYLGLGFSILSGALTLACMILPLLIRTQLIGLESINNEIRYAAKSCGLSQTAITFKILLPLLVPSIMLSLVIGMARSVSETAALLFTSGYVDRLPESIFDSGRVLSVHIFELAMNIPGGYVNSYKSAFVLMTLLLIINLFSLGVHQWLTKKMQS